MSHSSVKQVAVDFLLPQSKYNCDHKLITLCNGITALLISDTNDESTSLSVSVKSGSNNDPDDIPGLAHLVEHMVFVSNKSHPSPYHVVNNLLLAGGTINAYTTFSNTTYYLKIPVSAKLISDLNHKVKSESPIMDYLISGFSNFFKTPLFDQRFIKQEIFSVNEEHLSNITSCNKLFFFGSKLLAMGKYHHFSTGDSRTLSVKHKPLLTTYFNQYYSASNIKLVIKGPQSLNQLQKLLAFNFSDIKLTPLTPISTNKMFYPLTNLGKLLFIPSTLAKKFRIFFPLSNLLSDLNMICKLWIELLGNEGENSLCYYLVHVEGLANEITVFEQDIDEHNLLFIIEIELTTLGQNRLGSIIGLVFNAIELILTTDLSDICRFIIEFIKSLTIRFMYQDIDPDQLDEVVALSELLQTPIDYKNLFLGYNQWELSSIDIEKVNLFKTETAKWLSIDNFNTILINDKLTDPGLVLNEVDYSYEENYRFDYKILLLNKVHIYKTSINPNVNITIPPSNPFLLSLIEDKLYMNMCSPTNPLSFKVKSKDNSGPILQVCDTNNEIWYKYGSQFKSLYFTFQLKLETSMDPMVYIAIDLLCELLGDTLRIKMNQAEGLGTSWSLFPTLNNTPSITFNINVRFDFFKVLKYFINTIFEEIANFAKTSYTQFTRSRVKIRKKYEKLLLIDSFQQSTGVLYSLLEENNFTLIQRLNALEMIDFKLTAKIAAKFMRPDYVTILSTGDKHFDELNKVTDLLYINSKQSNTFVSDTGSQFSTFQVPVGKHVYKFSSTKDENICYYYLELGSKEDIYIRTISRLINFVIKLYIFDLRNERNLGYGIDSGVKLLRNSIGIYIFIKSNEYSYEFLSANIEDFLEKVYIKIESLSQKTFEKEILDPCGINFEENATNIIYDIQPFKSSTNFSECDKNYLGHKNHWEKIINQTYRFQGLNGEEDYDINLLRKITRIEFVSFFQNKLCPLSKNRSALLITSNRKDHTISNIIHRLGLMNITVPESLLMTIFQRHNGNADMTVAELVKKNKYKLYRKGNKLTTCFDPEYVIYSINKFQQKCRRFTTQK